MEEFSATFQVVAWIVGTGVTVAVTVLAGIIKFQNDDHRSTKQKLDDLRRDHADFRVEVANRYVSHDHLQRLEEQIEKRFDKLEALLKTAFTGGRDG